MANNGSGAGFCTSLSCTGRGNVISHSNLRHVANGMGISRHFNGFGLSTDAVVSSVRRGSTVSNNTSFTNTISDTM